MDGGGLFAAVVFDLLFLVVGGLMIWGGVSQARWWMVKDTDWWLLDTRKGIKRLFGDRGLRFYGASVGAVMVLVSVYALVSLFVRR
jgi:hypothetical protein